MVGSRIRVGGQRVLKFHVQTMRKMMVGLFLENNIGIGDRTEIEPEIKSLDAHRYSLLAARQVPIPSSPLSRLPLQTWA